MIYVKEKGKITNREYQGIAGIKERLATIELNDIVSKKILQKFGTTGRGTYYAAIKAHNMAHKMALIFMVHKCKMWHIKWRAFMMVLIQRK